MTSALATEKTLIQNALDAKTYVGEYDAFGRRTDVEAAEAHLHYRFQYRFWRTGHAKGCVTTSSGPGKAPGIVVIKEPSTRSAWNVRPNEVEFVFRQLMSYCVSVLFLLGSILFVVGSAYDILAQDLRLTSFQFSALVNWPFLIGSVVFVLGAYAGLLEVINVGSYEKTGKLILWRWTPDGATDADAFWCFWSFLIGSTIFLFVEIVSYLLIDASIDEREALVCGPYALGGALFVIGAALEVKQNGGILAPMSAEAGVAEEDDIAFPNASNATSSALQRPQPSSKYIAALGGLEDDGFVDVDEIEDEEAWDPVAWNMSIQNLVGSILFLIGGMGATWAGDDDSIVTKVPFLLGSILFTTGSLVALWLWKSEKFGLAYATKLNKFASIDQVKKGAATAPAFLDADLSTNIDQRRPVGIADVVSVTVCTVGLAAAVVNIGFSAGAMKSYEEDEHELNAGWDLVDALASFLLFVGATSLASAAHRVPTGWVYDALIWYLRAVIILFAASASAGVLGWISTTRLRARL